MKALTRLVLGLVIFDAALTAPTLEPINYDSETYDATLDDLDNLYNYENIPINQAEVTVQKYCTRSYWGLFLSNSFLVIYK